MDAGVMDDEKVACDLPVDSPVGFPLDSPIGFAC
jgi:hypothetical protein